VFDALDEGRVHLTGLGILAPHLAPDTAEELLTAAAGKSKFEIEQLLAERSPRLPVPASVMPLGRGADVGTGGEGAPAHLAGPEVVANMVSEGAARHPRARSLGCRESDSRIAARRCREMAEASIEARVKRALSWFGERCSRRVMPSQPAASASAESSDASPAVG
jgi:hypothetical protein